MTDEELDAIRSRMVHGLEFPAPGAIVIESGDDLIAVLDETERARNECAKFKALSEALEKELSATLTENQQLRDALTEIVQLEDSLPYACKDENGMCSYDHAQAIAESVLEGGNDD